MPTACPLCPNQMCVSHTHTHTPSKNWASDISIMASWEILAQAENQLGDISNPVCSTHIYCKRIRRTNPTPLQPPSPAIPHLQRVQQGDPLSSRLGHHSEKQNTLPPAPTSFHPPPPTRSIQSTLPKTALFDEHTIKEETREIKTGKGCVYVCSRCKREKAGGVKKKEEKRQRCIGFVSTAGKSAESCENGQCQRDCVCVCVLGISLYSSVTKEAPRAGPWTGLGLHLLWCCP